MPLKNNELIKLKKNFTMDNFVNHQRSTGSLPFFVTNEKILSETEEDTSDNKTFITDTDTTQKSRNLLFNRISGNRSKTASRQSTRVQPVNRMKSDTIPLKKSSSQLMG